jgi:uncharacterized membrane protein (UPF0127 family)
MLVKAHVRDYSDEYGWLHEDVGIASDDGITFLSRGFVEMTPRMSNKLSPVKHVHWMWMDRNIQVKCKVAATRQEKITGLQSYIGLRRDEGLYFPYPGGADVSMHQGSVKFPLDIIFLQENEVVHCVENTRVGSKDIWSCKDCDGVIEVNAGFVEANGIDFGDELTFFAISEKDLTDFQQDQREIEAERRRDALFGSIANNLV